MYLPSRLCGHPGHEDCCVKQFGAPSVPGSHLVQLHIHRPIDKRQVTNIGIQPVAISENYEAALWDRPVVLLPDEPVLQLPHIRIRYLHLYAIKENGGWIYSFGNMFYAALVEQYL